MNNNIKPKIGLALSGASSRSIFYLGFLEVLSEQGIPIDLIAASSGGTIVAASYACGTTEELKDFLFNLRRDRIFSLLGRENIKGGIYNLNKVEAQIQKFTLGKKFEDLKTVMGFVAVDIDQGEQVVLSMGDVARAARISCTVPGIFEPIKWGNKTLVDGGLLNLIPIDVVKSMGADIVIGINIRSTDHIFLPHQIKLKRFFNYLKKFFLIAYVKRIAGKAVKVFEQMDIFEYFVHSDLSSMELSRRPGLFDVLGKSLDIAVKAQADPTIREQFGRADLLITHQVKGGRKSYKLEYMKQAYEEGRHIAMENIHKIRTLIENYEHNH